MGGQSWASRWGTGGFVLLTVAVTLATPYLFSRYAMLQIAIILVGAILAMSLGLVWGFGGIMSFGQTAFFGIGGYTYAIAVENIGDSTLPLLLSIAVPAAVALLLGYFMFFGRLGDVFVGVVTLCVSLILFDFGNSTQDPFYTIGDAALNGFNGMAGIPPLNAPFNPSRTLDTTSMFFLCAGSLIAIYVLCRLTLASRFGRIAVAVKQNEIRAGLLGYNVAAVKIAIFMVGAGVAGFAGCLYASWNGFISPGVFGLPMMAQTIIWVVVGGLGTLIGPILGSVGLQYLVMVLGAAAIVDVNLVLGLLLIGIVVFLPEGIAPATRRGLQRLMAALFLRRRDAASRRGDSLKAGLAADRSAKA